MIKMKIKNALITLIIVVSISFLIQMYVQPMLQAKMVGENVENGNVTEAKQQIISLIEKDRYNALDVIKKYMIDPEQIGDRYDVYIGPSMSSWGSYGANRVFTIEESEPYLLKYVEEAKADGYLRRTVEILKLYYESQGEYEKAVGAVERGQERFQPSSLNHHELQLLKIEVALKSGNSEKATFYIDQYEPNMDERFPHTFLRLTKLKAELLVQQKETDKALSLLNEDIDNFQSWHEEMVADLKERNEYQAGMSGSPYYNALVLLRNQLEQMINNKGELGIVQGRVVRSNGEPISNVGIFLREENDVNQSVSSYERYQSTTREDGSFSFTGVLPGSYQIHTGFSYEQIDGWSWSVDTDDWIDVKAKETVFYPINITPLIELIEPTNYQVVREEEITFKWGPFPGAESFTLHGGIERDGSSTSFQMVSGIKENQITLSVEDLYAITSGIMFTDYEWQTVVPESVLGFSYVDGTFSWSVKAYNEAGNLVGQSNGYRLREETMGPLPFFHLKARQLSEADEMFLQGNVLEALEMYKKNVQEIEDDIHSLRMVTRIIGLNREREFEALPYWFSLAEKRPSADIFISIAQLYFQQENWTEFENWYAAAAKFENEMSPYVRSFYARALMKQGMLHEARDEFYEIIEEDRSNRFIGLLIAIDLYLEEDWKKVGELAEFYKERSYERPNWLNEIEKLEKEVPLPIVREVLYRFFVGNPMNEAILSDYPILHRFIKMLERVR